MLPFPAYLQGMETILENLTQILNRLVPSLPTRDGNVPLLLRQHNLLVGSQPTYKGWKPVENGVLRAYSIMFPAYLQGMETVPRSTPARYRLPGFPAYLQGMETCLPGGPGPARGGSQPTYKGWKLMVRGIKREDDRVPSLPTRDGNQT